MIRILIRLTKYDRRHYPLFALAVSSMFWAIADATTSYYLPIYINDFIKNIALIGFIFSTSSLFGALVDFPLGLLSDRINYRPIFYIGCFLTALLGIMAMFSTNFWHFILLMAIWGIYYEAIGISTFSFIVHKTNQKEHSETFGIAALFVALGYFIGPIITVPLIIRNKTQPFIAVIIFSAIAVLVHRLLLKNERQERDHIKIKGVKKITLKSIKEDLLYVKEFTRKGGTLLIASFLMNFWNSIFWVIGPIYTIKKEGAVFSGLTLSFYVLPFVLLQGLAGRFADNHGKYKTFLFGLFVAAIFTVLFGIVRDPLLILTSAFLSATGFAISSPAIGGIFADYATRYRNETGEIAALRGIALNLGYILGPLLGGISSQIIGLNGTFIMLGFGLLFAAISFYFVDKFKFKK